MAKAKPIMPRGEERRCGSSRCRYTIDQTLCI